MVVLCPAAVVWVAGREEGVVVRGRLEMDQLLPLREQQKHHRRRRNRRHPF